MSLRIGILQCDHVADDLVDAHGDYNDMFLDLLHAQDQNIEMAAYDLTADSFPVDLHACDGYIITGSKFSAYDDIPWIDKAKQLVVKLYQAKIPTIGICFGHQLIAEALGGKVEKAEDKGWGVGVQHWEIKNQTEWMRNTPLENFAMRASHQDQVIKMPNNSTIIAGSDFCPIAGFQTGEHILAFQGHPEYSKDYTKLLISGRLKRIGKEVLDVALDSLDQEVDSKNVGAWMVAFIKQSRLTS
jgi:GMP synthase-like glutamine amidotransferase